MRLAQNRKALKMEKDIKDVADGVRRNAVIRETLKMDAKMKRREGVNQRLEEEGRAAEATRKIKEREAAAAKEFQWTQQEKLSVELQDMKREEFVDIKLRQRLRQTSMELREFENKLKLAYVNKDLAAQLEEKKLAKLQEKLQDERERDLIEKIRERDSEEKAKAEQEAHLKRLQYKKELQEQIKVPSEDKYQQFILDKQMMDDVTRLLHEEDMREREMKMIKMKKTKEEMDCFWKAREVWREKERKTTEEEDRRLLQYWTQKDAENEEIAVKQKRAKEICEKRQEAVANRFVQMNARDEALLEALDELYVEESKAQSAQRLRDEMEAEIKRKIEIKLNFEDQKRMREEQRRKEKQMDEELRQELLRKFSEDERIERLTKERRRQKMLDHRKAIEDLIFERQRKRIEDEHAQIEEERFEEAQMNMRHKMIDEERHKMLQEHAKNLIGYLPKGLLKSTDFPHIGPEFLESKSNKNLEC